MSLAVQSGGAAAGPEWQRCLAEHLPAGAPLVRCVPPEAGQRMGGYVGRAVLALAKEARGAMLLQAERRWEY